MVYGVVPTSEVVVVVGIRFVGATSGRLRGLELRRGVSEAGLAFT